MDNDFYSLRVFNFIPVAGTVHYYFKCLTTPWCVESDKQERRIAALGLYNAFLLSSIPFISSGLEKLVF